MYYTELAVICLTAACIFFLPLIFLTALGIRKRIAAASRETSPFDDAVIDKIVTRLQTQTGKDDRLTMGTLNEQMSELRKDFDWLVTDRMIDQAIELARSGETSDFISGKTGISNAELVALTKHRRH